MTSELSPGLSVRTLVDELLAEQRNLTAVERFSRLHERDVPPKQAKYYRDLLPIRKPATGEQYRFVVNLDTCTGCKGCVTACHSLNGLDDHETWREVGLLSGGEPETARQQTITTSCHHCVEPACMEGCPVDAYEKDAATGIVRHLDDQCIGCQYCILKCPYQVPKYSKARGIVRKCDLCFHRLAIDQAPACVQGCPNEAIRIELVDQEVLLETLPPRATLFPGAWESSYTKPTTSYRSRTPLPKELRPAGSAKRRPEHAHHPLIWMLLLTQLSVGMFLFEGFYGGALFRGVALAAGFAGIFASTLHLGRPQYAWRAVIGLRHSWLSREIVAFGLFATMASGYTAMLSPGLPLVVMRAEPWLQILTSLSGLLAVFCSAMIYADTRRPFWDFGLTGPKFLGTTLLMGAATLGFAPVIVIVGLGKWLLESVPFLAGRNRLEVLQGSAELLGGPLRRFWYARCAFAFLGCIVLPVLMFGFGSHLALTLSCIVLCFAGEWVERYLFFRGVPVPAVPGGAAA